MSSQALARQKKTQEIATSASQIAIDTEREKVPFSVGFPIFIAVVLALIYAGFWAYKWLQDEQRLPVQEIVISGNISMLNKAELVSLIRQQARGSFFALDVDHVHKLMEIQPWVYNASVRKRWPSKLYIHIVEQKAVAMWNDDLLLNRYGDTFEGLQDKQYELPKTDSANVSDKMTKEQREILGQLPQLFGPMGSEKTALTGYTHMQRLLNTNGQRITLLSLSERFAWEAKLNNKVLLKLGRQEYINRLQRYIDVYPLLQQEEKLVSYVDLRYDTGLAVGWGDSREDIATPLNATNNNS